MKVTQSPDISNVTGEADIKRFSTLLFSQIISAINGNISFGDNFFGQQVVVTFTSANNDVVINHNLNKQVFTYLVLNRSDNMVIYNGSQPSTSAQIYLRSSASGTATIFLM